MAPFAVATAIVIAILVVLALAAEQLGVERDLALNAAAGEVGARATLLAARLDTALSAAPQASPAEIFRLVLDAHPDERLDQAVFLDGAGRKIATDPPAAFQARLSDLVLAFASTASPAPGVVRLVAELGDEHFAAVRPLAAIGGRVAFASPVSHYLAAWSQAARTVAALAAATVALIVAAGVIYAAEQRIKLKRARDEQAGRVRMELALKRGRCGLWTWDLQRDRISWSGSMFGVLGLSERSTCWRSADVQALMHPEDSGLAEIACRAFEARGECLDVEFRLRAADRHWVRLRLRAELMADETTGAPTLVGVAFEVTDGKGKMEAASERRLKEAIEAISDAFVLLDSNHRPILCNTKYQSLHNLLGDLSESHLREGGRASNYETQLADGRWLQISERRMRDGGSVAVAADITAFKEHDRQRLDSERLLMATASQLRASRRSLEEQSQQLTDLAERYQEQRAKAEAADRAKAQFLANMSHELRTPLNAIIGFSQLMGAQAFGPLGCERYREYCAHILASGRRLLNVVSDILDMSRLEAGRERLTYACVSADQAARSAVDDVAATAREKGVALNLDVRPDLALEADACALERILVTLMRNAVKFAPKGGSVEIRAEAAGEQVYFYVQDDGPGVAEDDIERLTRPFEQGDVVLENGMKGAGLGLAIANSLAELHGGTLRLASRSGKGAIAVVALPRAQRTPRSIVLADAA